MVRKYVQVRKDLIKKGLSVPVGDTHYFGSEKLNYRWIDDDILQIFYEDTWMEAESIDWIFGEEEI